MKAIFSPFSEDDFNEYLLNLIRARLKKRALIFECTYQVESSDSIKTYKPDDVIALLCRHNRIIKFSNMKLLNHIVYDLGQRFWYEELNSINNTIYDIYFKWLAKSTSS